MITLEITINAEMPKPATVKVKVQCDEVRTDADPPATKAEAWWHNRIMKALEDIGMEDAKRRNSKDAKFFTREMEPPKE